MDERIPMTWGQALVLLVGLVLGIIAGLCWNLVFEQAVIVVSILLAVVGILVSFWISANERRLRLEGLLGLVSSLGQSVALLREVADRIWSRVDTLGAGATGGANQPPHTATGVAGPAMFTEAAPELATTEPT